MRPFLPVRAVTALSAALMCAACATSVSPPVLPVAPALFGQPVPLPDISARTGAKAALAEHRAALAQANQRLADDAEFYEQVRQRFGATAK